MDNIYNFYNSILNIRNIDYEKEIEKIISEEKQTILIKTNDLSGFCKYIALAIKERLNSINVKTYYIDLNDILCVDHVFLIAEYKCEEGLKRFIIDPTFIQFVKKDNLKLQKLNDWPNEKISDYKLVRQLLNKGFIEIDNEIFNNYMNAFNDKKAVYNIEQFLLEKALESISKKSVI